jgi:hypothetical protein
MSVLVQPDFSKIDCHWESIRLTPNPVSYSVLSAILQLSVLDNDYHPTTKAITTRILRQWCASPQPTTEEICTALVDMAERKVIAIEDSRGRAVKITPLVASWESLPGLRDPKGLSV